MLVKPIYILTHVLMSISFGTKTPTFLTISVLLKAVGTTECDISYFKILDYASTYSQLKIKESFHIEQLKPELNESNKSRSMLVYRCISKCIYCCLQGVLVYFLLFLVCAGLSFHWLV